MDCRPRECVQNVVFLLPGMEKDPRNADRRLDFVLSLQHSSPSFKFTRVLEVEGYRTASESRNRNAIVSAFGNR